jgi:Family of unknown function (DUF6364)
VNLTLSVDRQIVERARKRAAMPGKSLDQRISDYLQEVADSGNVEQRIEEFKRLPSTGNSRVGSSIVTMPTNAPSFR